MGLQLAVIHFDEIAFISYNWIVVPAATNSSLAAAEQARKSGIPSPIMYTTTAGNPDTRMGAYALSMFESACMFTERFYDCKDREEVINTIKKNCLTPDHPMFYMEFSYRQLGRSDEWFRAAAARSGATQDAINRDLLNIWQGSTENSVLPPDLIDKIRHSKRPPCHTDISDGFVVQWYVDDEIREQERFKNKAFIMGMDASENIERDFTTFVMLDPEDMKVIATCRCNEANTIRVAQHVAKFLYTYPKLLFIPERNSMGAAIIDCLLLDLPKKQINPFTRIYNEVVQNYGDPKYKAIDVYDYSNLAGRVRATFGFRTSGSALSTSSSRNLLYKATMMKALEMNHSRIYDSTLINELCSLQVRNGRVDHPEGGHDDMVIAYMLTCYLVFFGKHLNMYGISMDEILATVNSKGERVDPVARQEQMEIKNRISQLADLINSNPSYMLKQSYLREFNALQALLEDQAEKVDPVAISQINRTEGQGSVNRAINALNRFADVLSRY